MTLNNLQNLYNEVHHLFTKYHDPGHDEKHVLRVSALSRKIAKSEGYDFKEAEAAGLLHDIGRTVKNRKFPHAIEGVPIAKKLLNEFAFFSEDASQRIISAIEHHSDLKTYTRLENILQDADKLDGMGAIGINRAYLSHSHLPDYDPEDIIPKPGKYGDFKTIHDLISLTTKWYNMLYTDTAKKIGKPRFEFAKQYMEEIKREINESK